MKFCADHWTRMREAVAARGLDHHVAGDGGEAVSRMASELVDGGAGKSTFEPLMAMHWAIVGNIVGATPLTMVDLIAYDGCPLCLANGRRHATFPEGCGEPDCDNPTRCASPTYYDEWIEYAANDQSAEHTRLFGPDCVASSTGESKGETDG